MCEALGQGVRWPKSRAKQTFRSRLRCWPYLLSRAQVLQKPLSTWQQPQLLRWTRAFPSPSRSSCSTAVIEDCTACRRPVPASWLAGPLFQRKPSWRWTCPLPIARYASRPAASEILGGPASSQFFDLTQTLEHALGCQTSVACANSLVRFTLETASKRARVSSRASRIPTTKRQKKPAEAAVSACLYVPCATMIVSCFTLCIGVKVYNVYSLFWGCQTSRSHDSLRAMCEQELRLRGV